MLEDAGVFETSLDNRRTAEIVIAEIGVDADRFPTAAHLASWPGLCPRRAAHGWLVAA